MNSPSSPPSRRVAILGAGISGLAAANRLIELEPDCQVALFDPRSRAGGVLSTRHEEGFQVEESADNFITTVPWGLDLCKRLGLGDELVQTNPEFRRTFVIHRGRLYRLPDGFLMMAPTQMWPMAVTPLLSPIGKLRAGLEYFIPPRKDDADESMAGFVRRRLGREVFERLVEPLVSGVYAADMDKLSLLATLPRFREMEREHGSLIRAMRRQMSAQRKNKSSAPRSGSQSGARYSMFVTLERGLTSLVDALVARLPQGSVQLDTPIERIERADAGWTVTPSGAASESFDAVIVATPAHVAAGLLDPIHTELASRLGSIEHQGTAILSVAYRRDQIKHPLNGMGFVVPGVENSPILAGSFSSQKYVHRAPADKVLIRFFVGGARRPEMAEMDDDRIEELVLKEVEPLLGISGKPIYKTTSHWPGTMPQYHVGHLDLVDRIDRDVASIDNLELAGNAYTGVGVPNCIHTGEQAAERILGHQPDQP